MAENLETRLDRQGREHLGGSVRWIRS
jgi:hypothetical protein